jgi:hypothetical protein
MTNIKSLNGSEINMGDSIIMPRDIKILETTMSITRNGRNSKKPIVKAVRNSLMRKAGTATTKGTSAADW